MEQHPLSRGLFPKNSYFLSASHSLNQTLISHQHIQLCGYSQRGSPLRELLRNVNTLNNSHCHHYLSGLCVTLVRSIVCVRCCQLLINPCGVSHDTVEDREGERQRDVEEAQHCARSVPAGFFLHSSIDSLILLHNISPPCRMCIDMLTVLAYPRIFQLDSSILLCHFFFYDEKLHV